MQVKVVVTFNFSSGGAGGARVDAELPGEVFTDGQARVIQGTGTNIPLALENLAHWINVHTRTSPNLIWHPGKK